MFVFDVWWVEFVVVGFLEIEVDLGYVFGIVLVIGV